MSKVCSINFELNKNWTTGSQMVVSKNATQGWTQFWKGERTSFDEVMKLATTYFAGQIVKQFSLTSSRTIFDYGCGPGFLADHLAQYGISVVGADINEYFIDECRKNHPQSLFIHISTDVFETRSELDRVLAGRQFDFVVLLSIAQYFKDTNEFERVINLLASYCCPGGRIIIADVIDDNTSTYRDALGLFNQCVRNGKLIAFFKFMLFVTSSSYARVHKHAELLKIRESFIQEMCLRNSLRYEKVDGLTIHPSRTNYVLSKRS